MSDEFENTDSDLVKTLRAQIKTLTKERDDAVKQASGLVAEKRSSSLAEAVTKRGLNPKVAGLIPSDVEDVNEWLDTYGELFGIQASSDEGSSPPVSGSGEAVEGQESFSRAASVENGSSLADPGTSEAKLAAATSREEILAVIAAAR